MTDEGYTKFVVEWTDRTPLDVPAVAELDRWRRLLFDAELIGYLEELQVGYGNLSVRTPGARGFVITATQTGHLRDTGPGHYAFVTDYDIDANRVVCRGALQASSETLTHAAIYELDSAIGAVAHVHHLPVWHYLKDTATATDSAAAYGTPAMAHEFKRLWRDTAFAEARVAAMGGHESGIVSIGDSLEEATRRILRLLGDFQSGNLKLVS